MKNQSQTTYPHETAGRLMTPNIPSIEDNATVGDVEQMLLTDTKKFETIDYIYVVDKEKRLKGAFSPKELFRSDKQTPVKALLPENVISVDTHTDQEQVALLALRNNLKVIPVVGKEGELLGVVPNHIIMRVLDSEAVENILRLGGVAHKGTFDDIFKLPLHVALKHRLPWLLLGLVGGMVTASIVGMFEGVLSKNLILAAFIPLIVYMADAVGTQTEAFIIRDLAVNPELNFARYVKRQTLIISLVGVVTSLVLYGATLILYHDFSISATLGLALFIATLSSLFSGLFIPYLFDKLNLDPANASGPVATIIQDVLSILVYFFIASSLL